MSEVKGGRLLIKRDGTTLEEYPAFPKDLPIEILYGKNLPITNFANPVLATPIVPFFYPCYLDIYICYDTATKITVLRIDGADTIEEPAFEEETVPARAAKIFQVPMWTGQSLNLKLSANGNIRTLLVLQTSGDH